MAARKLFTGPDDRRIKRALCIVAHPDDIEFYCGGTVLKMTSRGVLVDFVLATSGDKGARDVSKSRAKVARIREREQEAAAYILGVKRVAFLRHPDAELVENLELREEFVREIRESKPDVLLTFDPDVAYRYHPDHRVVGRVALDAAWPCARDPLTYPDMGPPHETAEAWLFGGPSGARVDLTIDVSDLLETKIQARLEHRSQTRNAAFLKRRWRQVPIQVLPRDRDLGRACRARHLVSPRQDDDQGRRVDQERAEVVDDRGRRVVQRPVVAGRQAGPQLRPCRRGDDVQVGRAAA